ncbi:histidine kinase [Microbulbifer sp. SAOS-129_SWC]|uniref:sensor histidine kinase n=1 Tax=Microbulbifer sp. SAOS-129_SWC TaxID=3145235 RepID=UPI0032164843
MYFRSPPGHHRFAPWVWLIFLGFYAFRPLVAPMTSAEWLLFGAGLGLFLWAYFRALHRCHAAPYIWLITLVGAVEAPFNAGASALFIYAAAFSGNRLPQRQAGAHLAALLAVIGLESWLLQLSPAFWLPASLVSMAVGTMGILDRVQSAAARQQAHDRDEIERLAKVAERERIARDMHDVIGHHLSSIALKSELAGRLLAHAGTSPMSLEQARHQLDEVQQLARAALSQARETIAGYRRRELRAELQQLRQWLQEQGFRVELAMALEQLTPRIESAAALILLEACTNIQRHSDGDRVALECRQRADCLQLRVADNGRASNIVEGNGLRGMRERARALGGQMRYHTEAGMQLEVELPLETRIEAA